MNTVKFFAVIAVSFVCLIAIAIEPSASFKLTNLTKVHWNSCIRRIRPLNSNKEIIMAVECHQVSFACLSSIPTTGLPKCKPVYGTRIQRGTSGNKSVAERIRVPINCVCAD